MFETYQSWGLPVDFTTALRDWTLLDELVIVGDPESCRATLERYAAVGVTDLMLQFAMPTVEPGVAAESQARFMAEVAQSPAVAK
jgi:alkanesulfonate monooxygenase SsuD/methylene tetrahydromethanopterin reductase-like flavin-dependent oxidoreductase (luciferase family)